MGSATPHGATDERDAGPRPSSNNGNAVVDWLDGPLEGDSANPTDPGVNKIRWKKGELLGVGAFGKVFLGLNLDSGELMAVKVIPVTSGPDGDEHTEELIREISLMKVLFNEHIVRYIGTERDEAHLYIFLEYVPGGSIASVVHKFGKFQEALVRAYTRQILVGLAYLHEHQIMHRDIKGANILISNDGVVKLADFGASKKITEMMTQNDCMSLKGTPYWMAPEVIMQTGHGRSADIWSVGCTVIEMITGKPPFSEFPTQVSVLFHIANTQDPPTIPEGVTEDCQDFLLLCFQRNPKERPTAATLLKHPFVMGGMESPLLPPPISSPSKQPAPAFELPPNATPAVAEEPVPRAVSTPTGTPRGTPTGKQPLDPFATPGEQKPKHLVEYAKVVRDHKGDKIADEQLVRDYLHQQVKEQDDILEDDFRKSLKLLTTKSKGKPGRRSGMSPLASPGHPTGSPSGKRRPTPDYGALATPTSEQVGGVALGEQPIKSQYHQSQMQKLANDDQDKLERERRKEREFKERKWQDELERERKFQAGEITSER